MKRLYYLVDDLTGSMKRRKLPDSFSDTELANNFLAFFHDKVQNLADSFYGTSPRPYPMYLLDVPYCGLTYFQLISLTRLNMLLRKSKKT